MTAQSSTGTPRGIRNKNPLNIRINPANKWQGRIPLNENTDGAFEQFITDIWGLRAGAVLMIAHFDRRGATSIRKLINIWAPPNENDTEAYIRSVAKVSGIDPDRVLDLHNFEDIRPVLVAMIRMENGQQPYTDKQIDAALIRAGVPAPMKPLSQTRTVQGGQIAAGGTVGAAVVEAVQETVVPAQDALISIAPYLDMAKWALLVMVLIGVGVMIWARIDDRRKGIK